MSNTVDSRVCMKMDTEQHWNEHPSFVPLAGELIVYSTDATHSYVRLKVGNGVTTVDNLPFIDASTIGGVNKDNIVAQSVAHRLTFGANSAYVFDGSQDVTVPVFDGTVI